MASQDGPTPTALEHQRRLHERPHEFGLYTAMRAVECANPDQPRIGKADHPADERVRVVQSPTMNFAAGSVTKVDSTPTGQTRIWQQVMGLLGPNGPMPLHLTETAWQRQHNHDDPTITSFLNLFHHRMLSLFYRARADAEPTLHFDRPEEDRFQDYVGSLIGIGTPAFRDRDAMPDLVKLHFAGRLGCQTRNAEGLEVILGAFLKLPVRIEEFVGQWIKLPDDCCNSLGVSGATTTLGLNATIGSHVWDCSQKFRIVVGPLSLDEYQRLLPGGESLNRLESVVRNYVGHQLQWEVRFQLKKDHVPSMQLGVSGNLGWRDWLVTENCEVDRDDLILQESVQ
ncbi:type VI secretion system baseplate subunit TssG [Aporhodopirellula aestuarii]|uniref:Type VI secretion system baseplate subunit TssG n=1 Tax=Aporhodopirellula aestuarii TaxID=2950107 RepID=A0ABT0TZ43_9BACT|nr:type VI secretion system baseplate subunit TssG [Aporhodopirellula aestuarii]MCM2369874.1 type VI secretion system baseplate subunit TssG [Aporhodopirellula aestuarii]